MKTIVLVLFIVIYSIISAETEWDENGIPIRQGNNIAWSGASATALNSDIICIWSDTRNGKRNIYGQRIDSAGNLLWPEDGIEISSTETSTDFQDNPVVIANSANDVIVAWLSFTDPEIWELRIQRIDVYGNKLWDDEVISLYSGDYIFSKIYLINDESDGAFIFWKSNGPAVLGLHILADGSIAPGWEPGGSLVILQCDYYYTNIIPDGYGGAVLAYFTGDYPEYSLFIQKINGSGDLLWGEDGIFLFDGPRSPITISVGNNDNYFCSWRDSELIHIQQIDLDGNILWDEDLTIQNYNYVYYLQTVIGNDGYPILCWKEYNMLYVQKIDTEGNLLWGSDHLIINDSYISYYDRDIISDNNNGIWITWGDYSEIYLQHVDSNGSILLEENGLSVCIHENHRWLPRIDSTLDDNICIFWGDNRNEFNGIYNQIIDFNGVIQLPENGSEIYKGLSGSTHYFTIIPNGDNPFLLWSDRRNIEADQIYMQSLNGDGSINFCENGIPVTQYTGNNQDDFNSIFDSNSDLIITVWEENREGYDQVFIQAVDESGNQTWSETGILLSTPTFHADKPYISSIDNSGISEYYIGWSELNSDWDFCVKGQKIINGEIQWTEGGVEIFNSSYDDELIGLVENFFIYQSGSWDNNDIYVKRVDAQGNTYPGWPENGIQVSNETSITSIYSMKSILIPDGLLIIWGEIINNDLGIYGQIITPEGNFLWQEGGLLLADQDYDQCNVSILYNGNIVMAWEDFRSVDNSEVYAQKFSIEGIELWQEGGVPVASGIDAYYTNPNLSYINDQYLIIYEEKIGYDDKDIKAQLLNEDGELLWQDNGIFLCNEYKDQKYPNAAVNNEDDVYITWLDGRSVLLGDEGINSIYGIYAQKLNIENNPIENKIIVNTIPDLSNYPNPFNPSTTIRFSIWNNSKIDLSIYNIKGQKIKTLTRNEYNKGIHSVIWHGDNESGQEVNSGIYFYKLNINSKTEMIKKCLLIK